MSNVTITRNDGEGRGAYHATVDGQQTQAELTYRKDDGGKVLVADHTFVPNDLRGKGIAGKLVDALVADAREEGFKIRPVCSYVVAAFRRNPDWDDVEA
ncbi:GNAT family N-acetyltransferase [Croceicoccus gelatinilyticus]|uniref:GNAT family N-acetyltransferase n=1 Tax=Croceicoccus gelatinilyticus TaxID=2835536 RepID=UPI001BD14446|nr:GNAT family N-acetyltransferase [Croceicoccus gelatinilyticus]MBS7669728.1 N-acetyltransferase [Croceicoccus gelatinilyticus]